MADFIIRRRGRHLAIYNTVSDNLVDTFDFEDGEGAVMACMFYTSLSQAITITYRNNAVGAESHHGGSWTPTPSTLQR